MEGAAMKFLAILILLILAPLGAAAQSYQGLWWNPAESGWGINLTHQGDILFATWFTYDANGNGQWLVVPRAELQPTTMSPMDMNDMMGMMGMPGMMGMMPGMVMSPPTYSGMLYRTTGPAFDAATFDPNAVTTTMVGYGTLTFDDMDNGVFEYALDGVYGTKMITRQAYAAAMPRCDFSAPGTANFQDLWWRSGGTESGWGLNIAQEGDIIFATWFTYDANGKGLWLYMPDTTKTGNMTYAGDVYRTTGPAFNIFPWKGAVTSTKVGTASLQFSDASNGTFTAKVGNATIVKPISRQLFASPASACR